MIHPHPTTTEKLRQLILQHLRSALVDLLRDSHDCFLDEDDELRKPRIEDMYEGMPKTIWSFILMDSDNPAIPGFDPPWVCSMEVECREDGLSVTTKFHLCLPASIGFRKVHGLLAEELLAGNPPSMTIDRDYDNREIWTVSFHHGTGIGWREPIPEYATRYFIWHVSDLLGVIRAVRRLSNDYKDAAAFRRVRETLRDVFQAD